MCSIHNTHTVRFIKIYLIIFIYLNIRHNLKLCQGLRNKFKIHLSLSAILCYITHICVHELYSKKEIWKEPDNDIPM